MSATGLYAVTVIGNDRSGIVAGVTKALYETGCNLEDATSTILRGHFSMMLVVSSDADAAQLEEALDDVASILGVTITARPVEEAALDFDAPTFDPFPASSAFSVVAPQPDVLQWSGGTVIPVGTSTFSFSIDVPDGLSQWHPDGLNAFTLRQVPVTATEVPEPATLVLLLVAGVIARVGQARARKSWNSR